MQSCRRVVKPFGMGMVENLGSTRQQMVERQKYRARAKLGLRQKEIAGLLSMG
jgi:hypothetical protein